MIKVLIITGNQLRHQYYVSEMGKHLEVTGVIFEEKIQQENKFKEVPDQFDKASEHFNNRAKSEQQYFSGKINIEHIPALHVKTGDSNSEETFQWVKEKKPEYLLLFGSSIIRNPLLSYFGDRVVNMHLGLSPYYRGAGTNFWPLVNNEPECVGATIHLATLKVDAGAILAQVRPEVSITDGPHDIGNKTIIAAIAKIPVILFAYHDQKKMPQKQNLAVGKVYKRKDLTVEAIEKLYQNFNMGMIKKYLDNKAERLAQFPIID